MTTELTADRLRRTADIPSSEQTGPADLGTPKGIIGQKRALSALRFGLGIQEIGFNIYVAGPPGIGKMTAVQSFLEDLAKAKETPRDLCYVYNFDDPYQPRAMCLPAGRGRNLQQDMRNLVEHVRREVPKAFESEEYSAQRDRVLKGLEKERALALERVAQRTTQEGFALESTPFGIAIVAMRDGKPLGDAETAQLPAAEREELERRRERLQEDLKGALKQIRTLTRTARDTMREVDRRAALFLVGGLIDDIRDSYSDLADVVAYLQAVQKDILENIETFKSALAAQSGTTAEAQTSVLPWVEETPFRKYEVNVLVDNSQQSGAPVVVELNPSYGVLFGRIEKETRLGTLSTDVTMIRPGSLHRANGGYLILRIEDVFKNPFTWDGLKRSLRGREIEIEELGERLGFFTTKTLRPQPIPLDVKTILVGSPLIYYLLHTYDSDFPELFKVQADFDTRMDWNDENVRDFVAFVRGVSEEERLLPADPGALAAFVEHAARIAEHQEKLSTHFGAVADLVREAHHWAREEGASRIAPAHVQKALDQKVYRSSLVKERIEEMIRRGTLLIDTKGAAVGQVNGLSVLALGDHAFGKPTRITASVGPGREGVVDIEREVETGGPIHSKGVLILSGYFAQRYAQDAPLTFSARLVFEQSYEGVDGDSASAAELYTLLSALSGLPVKQGVAVTGSVNQRGDMQAIGGVNEKIEGFFDVCRAGGLTGDQGVIIPASNVQNLMLRPDVVDATRAGRFHIWAVETADEGFAILTGAPAGERDADGRFPRMTVGDLVDRRLAEFGKRLRETLSKNGDEPAREGAQKKNRVAARVSRRAPHRGGKPNAKDA